MYKTHKHFHWFCHFPAFLKTYLYDCQFVKDPSFETKLHMCEIVRYCCLIVSFMSEFYELHGHILYSFTYWVDCLYLCFVEKFHNHSLYFLGYMNVLLKAVVSL